MALILVSCIFGLAAQAATAATERTIAPGQQIQGSLGGGVSAVFAVEIPPDHAVDAAVTFEGPQGKVTLRVPGQPDVRAIDGRLALVAEVSGPLRVVLTSAGEAVATARYTLVLGPPRPADDADRLRFAGQLRLSEGYRALDEESKGAPARARVLFEEAARLFERAGDRGGQFDAVSMAGETYDHEGEMRPARDHYARALEIAVAADDLRLQADAHGWIGLAEAHMGEMESAMTHLAEGRALARTSQDRKREAEVLLWLSFALNEQDRHEEAAEALGEALPLFVAAGDATSEAMARNNLGYYYQRQGDAARALEHHEEALRLRRRHRIRVHESQSLSNIGTVYTDLLDEPEKGRLYNEEALALRRELDDRIGEAWSLKALAESNARLGRHAEAVRLLDEAVVLFREIEKPKGEGGALVSLGNSRLALGEVGPAGAAFEAGLALARRVSSPASEAAALLGLAQVARARGDLSLARRHAEEAIAIIEASRARVPSGELRAFYFAVVRPTYELYVDLLMRAGDPRAALLASERSRARSLFDALAVGQAGATPVPATAVQDVDAIRARLGPETALVEYALGEERSYAWVLSAGGLSSVELAGRTAIENAARRWAALLTARSTAKGAGRGAEISRSDREQPAAAQALSDLVLRPLSLPAVARVAVVSEGALQYVPFAALPVPGSSRPLATRFEVVSLPSGSVLATLRESPWRSGPAPPPAAGDANPAVVVVADPVFRKDDPRVAHAAAEPAALALPRRVALRSAEESGVGSLPRLFFSRAEAEAIVRLAPARGARVLLDFDASREAVVSGALAGARIVHFATHGIANSRHPELSGLMLSGVDATGQGRDGFLRLADIDSLRLSADLVVLSACQTALGKEVRGEGLLGLARAFMAAGTPRVVATLWRVDDRATAALMKRFYTAMLVRGHSPAAALREAQLSLAAEPQWRSPYYWAAFTLVGEWS